MAAAYCALANGGEWRTPRLILGGEGLATVDVGTVQDAIVDTEGVRNLPDEDDMEGKELSNDDLAGTIDDDLAGEMVIRDLAEEEALPGEEPVVERAAPAVETPVVPEGVRAAHGSGLVSRVVEPDVARWICRVPLAEVVTRGTGKKARLAKYRVFGKSGTAQKPDPATGAYSNRLHVSSFVCGAPADRPRVIVVVSVDEPSTAGEHFGGTVAAPAAARILERTLELLGVPPGDPGPVASVDEDVTAD